MLDIVLIAFICIKNIICADYYLPFRGKKGNITALSFFVYISTFVQCCNGKRWKRLLTLFGAIFFDSVQVEHLFAEHSRRIFLLTFRHIKKGRYIALLGMIENKCVVSQIPQSTVANTLADTQTCVVWNILGVFLDFHWERWVVHKTMVIITSSTFVYLSVYLSVGFVCSCITYTISRIMCRAWTHMA